MKKILIGLLVIFSLNFILQNFKYTKANASQETISNKLIRFHVLANSDCVQDQSLKLKVRDSVIKFMYPKLINSKSIAESKKILEENNKGILEVCQKTISENGYSYNVKTSLSKENFPIRSYGNITLPEGKYEAYKIIIGNGQGHNWWCVMFPPLCFIDITKGNLSEKQTEKQMRKTLSKDEYRLVNKDSKSKPSSNKIILKLKIVEILHKL